MAEQYPQIFASIGKHPTTEGGFEPTVDDLLKAAENPRVVAIGETGLDYFRSEGDLTWQHERFHAHIEAAKVCKKPLIIHTRAAADDTMNTLRDMQASEAGGVMHCFAEDWEVAKAALDIGFYISFSGIVTFKSAKSVQEVAMKARSIASWLKPMHLIWHRYRIEVKQMSRRLFGIRPSTLPMPEAFH